MRLMGRPRKRWSDNVREDAQRLGVGDWRRAALNRDTWRAPVTAAVGLQVLKSHQSKSKSKSKSKSNSKEASP